MKFGIFIVTPWGSKILGTEDGQELWFGGLVETIDFIKENKIEVYDSTVIREIAPIKSHNSDGIIVNEFDSVAINKMLNGEYPDIIYW